MEDRMGPWGHRDTLESTPPFLGLGDYLWYTRQARRIRRAHPDTRQGRRYAARRIRRLNREGWARYARHFALRGGARHG